jgi:hypothetical protein
MALVMAQHRESRIASTEEDDAVTFIKSAVSQLLESQ